MSDKTTVDIFVAINEDGTYWVDNDIDDVRANADEGYALRIVHLKVAITPPAWTEVECDIPDDAGDTIEIAPQPAAEQA